MRGKGKTQRDRGREGKNGSQTKMMVRERERERLKAELLNASFLLPFASCLTGLLAPSINN